MVLGYELHRSLKLKVGDSVVLFGKPFTLARCNGERGNKDDVTAWISLAEAQELLRQPGRINAILALECLCVGRSGLDRIRRDLARVLPGTQVVENESAVLARAEARTRASEEARAAVETEAANRSRALAEWGRAAAGVAVAAMAACGLWLAVQGARAARARRGEIGVLRAMGLRPRHVMTLLLGRAGVLGLAGGLGGAAAGLLAGRWVGHAWMGVAAAAGWRGSVATAALAVVAAVVLAAVAEWIPGLLAATEDPAEAVRGSEG
jgi:putative ABC transport system permease protein